MNTIPAVPAVSATSADPSVHLAALLGLSADTSSEGLLRAAADHLTRLSRTLDDLLMQGLHLSGALGWVSVPETEWRLAERVRAELAGKAPATRGDTPPVQ